MEIKTSLKPSDRGGRGGDLKGILSSSPSNKNPSLYLTKKLSSFKNNLNLCVKKQLKQ